MTTTRLDDRSQKQQVGVVLFATCLDPPVSAKGAPPTKDVEECVLPTHEELPA